MADQYALRHPCGTGGEDRVERIGINHLPAHGIERLRIFLCLQQVRKKQDPRQGEQIAGFLQMLFIRDDVRRLQNLLCFLQAVVRELRIQGNIEAACIDDAPERRKCRNSLVHVDSCSAALLPECGRKDSGGRSFLHAFDKEGSDFPAVLHHLPEGPLPPFILREDLVREHRGAVFEVFQYISHSGLHFIYDVLPVRLLPQAVTVLR